MVRPARPRVSRALDRSTLNDLLDHLEDRLQAEGCDQTLRHSRAFLRKHGVDVRSAVRWLKKAQGYCDCEVLMNVPYHPWLDLRE